MLVGVIMLPLTVGKYIYPTSPRKVCHFNLNISMEEPIL